MPVNFEMNMEESKSLKQHKSALLRILIVEDVIDRQEILKNIYREQAWVMVHTAGRAIRLLKSFDFNLISLDLNLATQNDSDAVVQEIPLSRNAATPILLHSMDQAIVDRIVKELPHAIHISISSLIKSNSYIHKIRMHLREGVPHDWNKVFAG